MTLVLLWRVPPRRVGLRWRGPAGLASAIEREPLAPVAAVVGPPGSGGSVSFPPMAILANADSPVPAGGVGSVAWSTVIGAPMIWDGLRWRTFAFFYLPPDTAPEWLPEGAVAYADFAEGNYWRQDIGVCALADVMPDPSALVTPGVGLTTGEQSTLFGSYSYLSAEAFALFAEGCAVAIDFELELVSGSLVSFGSWIQAYLAYSDANFTQQLRVTPYIGTAGEHVRAEAWSDDPAGSDVGDTVVAGAFVRMAANLDPATGTVLLSYEGDALDGAAWAGDYAALDRLLVGATIEPGGGDTFVGKATIARVAFYPQTDQAGIDALTEVPAPFSPGYLAPLGWWDPSDLSTLFQNSDGTGAVAADGDPVGYVADKSGNGNHLIQADEGRRPTYKTAGGRHWLEFNGAIDCIAKVFAVAKPFDRIMGLRPLDTDYCHFFSSTGGSNQGILYNNDGPFALYSGAVLNTAIAVVADTDYVLTERYSGSDGSLAADTGAYTTGEVGADAPNGLVVGANTNQADWFAHMRWYGGVISDGALAAEDIAAMRTWLADKQGRVL